jgi:hypothetical protein
VDTLNALGKYCPAEERSEGFLILVIEGTRPMPPFNLQRFLAETGLSIARLASYLQVAQTYLEGAAAGQADLTRRDREACRTLWRRLTQAVQIELPFAEPPSTFTREHARFLARSRAETLPAWFAEAAAPPGRSGKRANARSRPTRVKRTKGTDSRRKKTGKGQGGPRAGRRTAAT